MHGMRVEVRGQLGRSQFFLSTLWVPGIELTSSGLPASSFYSLSIEPSLQQPPWVLMLADSSPSLSPYSGEMTRRWEMKGTWRGTLSM